VRRLIVCTLFALLTVQVASADVSLVERRAVRKDVRHKSKSDPHGRQPGPGIPGTANATGSMQLTDASGLEYFINTNITFSTSSSASGAMSEASYTGPVHATTSMGGTTSSTLNDAFDGYGSICVSTGLMGPCETGNASYIIYNKNGPPTTECGGRQVDFPAQNMTVGTTTVQFSRKVFVPTNDSFGRWLNIVTNTGSSVATFNMITSNNLGSDNNTKITGSSNGNNTAETTDTWVSSFQNYSGNTSSDVRLAHVLQSPSSATPVSFIHFVDGDDNPYWDYPITLNPGETKIIATFVVGQPSNAAARAKAAELAGLPDNAVQCLSTAERAEIVNFAPPAPPVPALGKTGLAALGILLAGFAVVMLRRRSATA
jgi:hypothetical protein